MNNLNFVLTHHATQRHQQRGVSHDLIELVLMFGKERPVGDGRVSVWVDREGMAEIAAYLGEQRFHKVETRLRGIYIIVRDADVVTIAHAH